MRSGTRIRGSRAALVAVVGVTTFLAVPGTASAHGRAGMAWVQLNPSPSPSPRVYAAMAFDAAHGQDVLVGIGGRHDRVDTWTWDGTAWTKHHLRSNPPVRSASIAYDAAHGAVVLFGGFFLNETESNETWIWDGTTWTQVTPPVSPPARFGAGMAYDPTLGEVVLFGGFIIGGDACRDTWAWDGTTWTELHPAPAGDAGVGRDGRRAVPPAPGPLRGDLEARVGHVVVGRSGLDAERPVAGARVPGRTGDGGRSDRRHAALRRCRRLRAPCPRRHLASRSGVAATYAPTW